MSSIRAYGRGWTKHDVSGIERLMIQDVLRATLNHAVKTTPPADLFWLADGFGDPDARLKRQMIGHVERGRSQLQSYIRQGESLRAELNAVFASEPVKPRHLAALGDFIDAIEDNARRDALDLRRRLNVLRKQSRQIARYLPTMVPFFAEVLGEIAAQGRSEIEERLDFALFLRALRAIHDQENDVVATFTDEDEPDAIERFFKKALAQSA